MRPAMGPAMRVLWIAIAAVAIAGSAHAATHLATCSLNGVSLSSDITVGFVGVGSGAGDFTSGSGSDLALASLGPTGSALATASIVPAVGDPKDKAEGSVEARFEFGTPVGTTPFDTFKFEATGVGSALNATNLAGNASAASVVGQATVEFFVDIVPPNDCDGFIQLSDLRALAPFETFLEVNVIQDPGLPTQTLLATIPDGSPGQVIPIVEDKGYLIQFDYELFVPNGVDPPFSIVFSGAVSSSLPAPALGGRGALLLGLLVVATTVLALRAGRARPA